MPPSPDVSPGTASAVAARPAIVANEPARAVEAPSTGQAGVETSQPVINPADQRAISQEAAQGIAPNGNSRKALESITRLLKEEKKKPIHVKMQQEISRLKESSNTEDKALGYDFDIAQKQAELSSINENITALKAALAKPDLPAESKAKYETALKELEDKKGLDADIKKLQQERADTVGDEPNQLTALAQRFGVNDKDPLQSVYSELQRAAENLKGDKEYFQSLKDKGFSDDEIKETKEAVRLLRGEKTPAEKVVNKVLKGGGLLAALAALMMWLASKKTQGGGGGMG